jgi:hypothetical protein
MPKRPELPRHDGNKPHSNESGHHGWLWGRRQESDKGQKSDNNIELLKIQSIHSTRGLKEGKKNSQTKPSAGLKIGEDGSYLGEK